MAVKIKIYSRICIYLRESGVFALYFSPVGYVQAAIVADLLAEAAAGIAAAQQVRGKWLLQPVVAMQPASNLCAFTRERN